MTHIANIGERGARRRLVGGIVWLVAGVAGTIVLILRRSALPWYEVLILPFTLAAVGWLQAREKT